MSNAFWHGFADMHAISNNGPLVITKGEGSWIWDEKGKKYFDAAGALWYMNVGHGRKEIGEAMAAQAADIASYSSLKWMSRRAYTSSRPLAGFQRNSQLLACLFHLSLMNLP